MNLQSLRNRIKNITDYSADLQVYNDQLDQLINDAYNMVWTEKRWIFATKQYEFKFHPDILPLRDALGATPVNASVVKGSRRVTFSAAMDRLVPEVWEGQPIQIQSLEYVISKVVDTSSLLLDRIFVGTTDTDDETWIIKKRYYDLPQDSIELLSLAHRDTPVATGSGIPAHGKLIGLMPRRDETLGLRMDYKSSYAEAYVWSPSQSIPSGEKVDVTIGSNATGGFVVGTWLEVCWAFEKDGKIGPLSEPLSFKVTGVEQGQTGTLDIKFLSWDDQTIIADSFTTKDTVPSQYEGYRKRIFWNSNYDRATGERLGLPTWKDFNKGGAIRNASAYLDIVLAEDTAGSVVITHLNQIDSGNARYIEYDGQHLRIRPYPRVDSWDIAVAQLASTDDYTKVDQDFLKVGIARYYYKPNMLTHITDTPEMPAEFHQLIVYKALEAMYDKVGLSGNSGSYRQRYEKEVKQLQKRYTDSIDMVVQRGQFQMSGGNRFFYDFNSLKTNG